MGSRYASAVLGAVVLVYATVFLSMVVQPRAAAATASVKTCGGGSITLKAREKRVLTLHNRVRANHGLRPLCVDPRLIKSARSHSREMIQKDYFAHESYDGEGVGARLRRFGYGGKAYAENIAGGYGRPSRPDSIFESWMNSAGHKSNIMDGGLRRVGVGTYKGNYKGSGGYTMYTVDFGR